MLWYEVEIAVGLFGGLLLVLEITFQLGRLVKRHTRDDEAQLGTIQAATLGLLGLLLGFSFSGAADRFVDHQELIVQEANAIGTAYLRADLLAEPYRGQLQGALKQYIETRIGLFEDPVAPRESETRRQSEELHDRIWQAAMTGVKESPQFNEVVLPPVNEVIDLHAARLAALDRHLPSLVLVTLLIAAAVGVASLGYGCGLSGKRNLTLTTALSLLVSLALWVTIDLDYPRLGLVRVDQQALVDLRESLH